MEQGRPRPDWAVKAPRQPQQSALSVSVLLIEPDTDRATAVCNALLNLPNEPPGIQHVTTLAAARSYLAHHDVDVVLWNRTISTDPADHRALSQLASARALFLPLDNTRLEQGDWLVSVLGYVAQRKNIEVNLRVFEEALYEEKERAQVTLDSIGDAVLVTDTQGRVTYLNSVAEKMTGWTADEARGHPLPLVFNIVDGVSGAAATNPAISAMQEDRTVGLDDNCMLVRRDGSSARIEDSAAPIHDRNGKVTGAVIVFHDVSQSRAMISRMAHLAHHDALTGLPNRVLLTERLSRAIGLTHRHSKQVALLFVDLDHFKAINDTLGHAIGDRVLRAIAHRLSACVRASDTVCRLGGDEFLILLAEIDRPEAAAQIADKLLETVARPMRIDGHTLYVSASVGISIHPDDGQDAEGIIAHADKAMYQAKARARDRYDYLDTSAGPAQASRYPFTHEPPVALDEADLQLHYQPQYELASRRIVGMEALVRWNDPSRGLVAPDQFLRLAEQHGLAMSIGQWVLSEACRQSLAWTASGLPALPVSINLSAAQFRHPALADDVAATLTQSGVDPTSIVLEIPEQVLMQDVDAAARTLVALKDTGVQIAVDQFGLGRLSLHHLRRFPVDILKIDRSFLREMGGGSDAAAMIDLTVGLAAILKRRMVACGVEAAEQVSFLREHACENAQGYYFSRPLPAEDCSRLMAS